MSVTERMAYDEDFAQIVAIDTRLEEHLAAGTIVIPDGPAGALVTPDGIVPEATLDRVKSDDFVGFAEYKKLRLAKNAHLTAFYDSFPEIKELPAPVVSAMLQYALVILQN